MSLEAALRFVEARPDLCYQCGPTIAQFHAAKDHKRRLLRAPNQVGKTLAGAWEANRASLENSGSVGLVVIADLDNHYATVCKKIDSVIARGELHSACRYVEGRGYYIHGKRGIKYANGSVWEFRSGRSQVQALENITADWVWVDEVPNPEHWGGIIRATVARDAPLWMTFTPIGRPVKWLKAKVEGNPAANEPPEDTDADGAPRWAQFRPSLSPEECHWLTAQRIDQIASDYPEDERPQRVHGEWEGITRERVWHAYTHAGAVGSYSDPPPAALWGLGADHGELAGREVVFLVAWLPSPDWVRFWVVDEYVSENRGDERDDARGILAMLRRHDLSAYRIAKAVGDTNSGGKGAKGESVNAMISRAVAMELGHAPHLPPFEFQPADKRGGMRAAGVRLINVGLARQQFHVSPRCKAAQATLRHWQGADDGYKHAADALLYIATPVLDRNVMPTATRGGW